jgi:virginiamycin B lyase
MNEHHRMLRLGWLMVLLATATICLVAAGAHAAAPTPGAMVLALADLPKEPGTWRRVDGRIVDNASKAQADKTSFSAVVSSGRLTGYFEAFVVRLVSFKADGKRKVLLPLLDAVFSDVGVYDSAAAAQTAFDNRSQPSFKAVPTSTTVGQQIRLYKGNLRSPYSTLSLRTQDAWVVAWRDGAVIADVGVAGPSPLAKDALSLARTIEKRIDTRVAGLVPPVSSGRIRIYADPRIVKPSAIAVGSDGALWFTNTGSNSIGRISTDGQLTIFTDPGIKVPQEIVAGPDGALWFTNFAGNSIGRISTYGQVTSFTDPSIMSPYGITAGPDGALWFTNFGGTSIGRITTAGTVTSYANGDASDAEGITPGSDGALWFAEHGAIGRLGTSGAIRFFAGPRTNPWDVAAGPDGALWFSGLDGIGRVSTSGVISTITNPNIDVPGEIVAGPDGALWFTEGGAIGRLSMEGQVQTFTAPTLSGAFGITVGPDSALWFTAKGAIGRVSTT